MAGVKRSCSLAFSPIEIWNNDGDFSMTIPLIDDARQPNHDPSPAAPSQHLPQAMSLCEECYLLDDAISRFLQDTITDKVQPLKIGSSVENCRSKQNRCRLCQFLVESYELAYPASSLPSAWSPKALRRGLYLRRDREDGPWYDTVAVETTVPGCSHAWLQAGKARERPLDDPKICLTIVRSEAQHRLQQDLGPKLRSVPGSGQNLDAALIQSWLEVCLRTHSHSCGKSTVLERRFLRLHVIDVEKRQVVAASLDDQYVALSYVWGVVDRQRYDEWTWSSHRVKTAHGTSYIPLPASLPQTVEDAISLTARIGQRFLWVDALCIDQHNPQHCSQQVDNMDLVYQCALMTVIAFDGVHADSGLAGVSRPMEQLAQPEVQLRNCHLMATHLPNASIEQGKSPWDQRAWTMQELVLSRRSLFLGRNEAIWKCREEYFHDTIDFTACPERTKFTLSNDIFWDNCNSVQLNSPIWNFSTFSDILTIYSGRKLKHQSEVLNACRGMYHHMERLTDMTWTHGLPKGQLLPALLWKPHAYNCIIRRSEFPSWTWAGWEGRIEYTYWLHDGESLDFPDKTDQDREIIMLVGENSFRDTGEMRRLYDNDAVSFQILGDRLCISSYIAKFKVQRVRRQDQTLHHLKTGSLQRRKAVGDHWTLLRKDGSPLHDALGEYQTFEKTDYLFRLHPDWSHRVSINKNEVKVLFIKHYSFIRDSEQSNNWARDVVSTLVVLPDSGDDMIRIAAIVIPVKVWVEASPEFTMVRIV